MFDCDAPIETDVCQGGVCVTGGEATLCVQACGGPADCAEGIACVPTMGAPGPGICYPFCQSDDECLMDCIVPPGEMVGYCS